MSKLIALIDGSVYAESVCDHAAWVAEKTGAAVELVHVLGRRNATAGSADLSGNIGLGARSTLLEELAEIDERRAKLELERGRHLLEAAEARMAEDGIKDTSSKLRHGDLIEAVQEFEKDAEIIVVGKRGEAADFAKLHLGSNLERVVRAAHKPILVAARAYKPVKRILLAFDGGPSSLKAVHFAAVSQLFKGADCTLVTVGTQTDFARNALEDAAHILTSSGLNAETQMEVGDADTVIKKKIEEDGYDMLLMGAYGHSRIRNLIIGSTTTEMVRSCLVPVMLFR